MNASLFVFSELVFSIGSRSLRRLLLFAVFVLCFLIVFGFFFLLSTSARSKSLLPSRQMKAFLAPDLAGEQVNAAYYSVKELDGVQRVTYRVGWEIREKITSGVLLIEVDSSASIVSVQETIEKMPGILELETKGSVEVNNMLLMSAPLRIGLLLGLAITAFGGLYYARLAFVDVLNVFKVSIRLMRFWGTQERTIQIPIIMLGITCALLASGVFVTILYMLRAYLGGNLTVMGLVPGLQDSTRVLMVSLLSVPLASVLGVLAGVLGVSRANDPIFHLYNGSS